MFLLQNQWHSASGGFDMRLAVYDILGKEVSLLFRGKINPGTYEINWNAADFPSGIYFYKLTAGNYTSVKKMILIK